MDWDISLYFFSVRTYGFEGPGLLRLWAQAQVWLETSALSSLCEQHVRYARSSDRGLTSRVNAEGLTR